MDQLIHSIKTVYILSLQLISSNPIFVAPHSRSPVGVGRHRSPRGGPCGPPALVQDMRRLSPPRRISPPRGLVRRSPRRLSLFLVALYNSLNMQEGFWKKCFRSVNS